MPIFRMPVVLRANYPHANCPHANSPHANYPSTVGEYLECCNNPLKPRRSQVSSFTEISVLFKEGIIKIISYERRAYESVDEKSLS